MAAEDSSASRKTKAVFLVLEKDMLKFELKESWEFLGFLAYPYMCIMHVHTPARWTISAGNSAFHPPLHSCK